MTFLGWPACYDSGFLLSVNYTALRSGASGRFAYVGKRGLAYTKNGFPPDSQSLSLLVLSDFGLAAKKITICGANRMKLNRHNVNTKVR